MAITQQPPSERSNQSTGEAGVTLDEAGALREFWQRMLELLELRPGNAVPTPPWMGDLTSIILKHGHERYAQALWDFTMMEDADYTAIKFVRARNLDIEKATKMFIECLKWRIEAGVDTLRETALKSDPDGIDPETFARQVNRGFTYIQGFNALGGPVVYVFVKGVKAGEQSQAIMEEFIAWCMECIRLFTQDPQRKCTVVIDLAGFGMSNMDWKATLFFSKCLEAYYPECLQILVLVNAPWIFQGVWRVLGPMLDPVVRAKVLFAKNSDDILTRIDKRWLLKQLGGHSKYEWTYIPPDPSSKVDEARKHELMAQRKILIHQYIEATNRWVDDDSAQSIELRQFVALRMRVQYLSLDPHIRAKTTYHRAENIKPNGLIGFRRSDNSQAPDWEYVGHSRSRETLLEKLEQMKARFEKDRIAYPSIDFQL